MSHKQDFIVFSEIISKLVESLSYKEFKREHSIYLYKRYFFRKSMNFLQRARTMQL